MDKYHLRRQILAALLDSEPAASTIEDLMCWPPIEMSDEPRTDVAGEVRGLLSHGYVRDFRPGRKPLLRIATKGRDQINQEADLDEYVWGEYASKFAQ